MQIWIISRRRHLHAGTRYNARGLDDDGNVGNFVETEQIVLYQKYIFSFFQIRGSVPIFWSQKSITAQTSVKRNKEATAKIFDKHVTEIGKDYKHCLFINLL